MNRRHLLKTSLGAAAFLPATRILADVASELPARTLQGVTTRLRARDVHDFAASLRGEVLLPDQSGYEQARRVWNGMFDRRPALIARCAAPSDVMRAVDFAREHQLLTAVRAGGHSLSGKSTCDGGIIIDVSPMQSVRVDPGRRIARVDGGALLQHLDRKTSVFGLVTTAGTVSHTGAAGLSLGGGFGRVARRFGLACDNLRSVDVVTSDGRLLTASNDQNAELFWGLRGGGGNFGVATGFEYDLHPMDPVVLAGMIAWPIAQARDVLNFYAEFAMKAPDELNLDPVLTSTTDGPVVAFEACWTADLAQGERVLSAVRSFGKPAFDRIAPMKYLDLQSSSDQRLAHGIRFYGKSGFVSVLDARVIEALVEAFGAAPPGSFSIVLQQSGGAIGRVPISATAFPNRGASNWLMVSKGWTNASEDVRHTENVRNAWKSIEPLITGLYVNSITDDERTRVASNYGANYVRLQQLKRRYDPGNMFRLNANVLPA